jgi:lysophospholipase L1-like esterase
MLTKHPAIYAAIGVFIGLVACGGGHGSTAPTNDPPSIACPVPPSPVESLDGSAQPVSYPAPTVTAGQAPLNTGCLPVSGASFPIGTNTVTCTTSDAKARTASCTFSVVVLPQPKLAVTSFLAFGDSVTWGEDGRASTSDAAQVSRQHVYVQLPFGQRYPDILQQELQARYQTQTPTVFNAGCPGESLSTPGEFVSCPGQRMDDPSAYRRLTSLASLHKYDALLLMEGSNDVDAAAKDSTVLPVAVGYLQKMVDAAKGSGMKVIVATIPPMVPPGAFGRAVGYQIVPNFNDQVRGVGTAAGVPLADVYAGFGSDASTLIGFDGLHPNPDGYKRIADTFLASIKSALESPTTTSQGVRRLR